MVSGFSEFAVGSADLLRWRRRALGAVAAAHLAGVVVPGALAGFTEGPDAVFGGAAGLALAWLNVAVIVVACGSQFAALAGWRRCQAVLRAAGARRRRRRVILAGCAGLLIVAAWTAEAGYVLVAADAVRSGGLDEPVSSLGAGLDAGALLGGGLTLAVTLVLLVLAFPARLLVRQLRRTAPRDREWLGAASGLAQVWPAPGAP